MGQTGIKVSEIGFGAWGIGGASAGFPAYGPTKDEESRSTLRRAFDLGVNFYDTSDLYGAGHSERLIGETFKDVRDQVIISTKVGFSSATDSQDLSVRTIERSLDASLARLQTDYIDLYQLHSPDIDSLDLGPGEAGQTSHEQELLSNLKSLVKKGKVRALGISIRSPDDGLTAVRELGFKVLEVNYNLIDQRALDNGLLDLCHRQGIGVIARTPLCFGFLTGEYSPDTTFDVTDHRSHWPMEQITLWANAHLLFISAVNSGDEDTPVQTALRFCLSHKGISTVIPGLLTRKEVEENVQASEKGPFSPLQLQKVAQIYQDNTFFVGKTSS